jgi:hypothetical protein
MANSRRVATTRPAELDLLRQINVLVRCAACGRHYTVSLRDVLMSQEMIHEGCPVCHETECLPLTYAALANEAALREFDQSWSQSLQRVRAAGFDLTVCRPALSH